MGSKQSIHLYTDLPDTLDTSVFNRFEKRFNITVHVHFQSAASILSTLKKERWNSNIDLVIMSNALDLNYLADNKILASSNKSRNSWQALFSNPFVFEFPKDSIPFVTTYGQLFRNDKARVDPILIQDYSKWANLIPTLNLIYPIYSVDQVQSKLLYSDSLKGRDIRHIRIGRYSDFDDMKKCIFPDQFYKGSVGIIGGIGQINNSENKRNARLLYDYAKSVAFRKSFSKKVNLFPIVGEKDNKTRYPILFQSVPILKNK